MTFTPAEGTCVYMEPFDNAARGWDGSPVTGTIRSVKRKYYYVALSSKYISNEIKVDLATNVCRDRNLNGGYIVYGSLEAYQQGQERKRLLLEIRRALSHPGALSSLSYEELRSLHTIVCKDSQVDD